MSERIENCCGRCGQVLPPVFRRQIRHLLAEQGEAALVWILEWEAAGLRRQLKWHELPERNSCR